MFRCYFHIYRENNQILVVTDSKNDDGHRKATENIWKDVLQYILWIVEPLQPGKIIFKSFKLPFRETRYGHRRLRENILLYIFWV